MTGLLRFRTWMPLLLVLLCAVPADAQVAMHVEIPVGFYNPKTFDITGHNVARGDNAMVLYDRNFGMNTRTNPYGVEVIAKKTGMTSDGHAEVYKVTAITSVWECQRQQQQAAQPTGDNSQGDPQTAPAVSCGNAEIPNEGIVLSASGGIRNAVLDWLKVGDTFNLREDWFQTKDTPVSVVDPNMQNNPMACGFPGCRGSGQLIVYTSAYGKPKTGTNEFGFEVTVVNGVVVAQEGSDSTIPDSAALASNTFVVSGHGNAREWLIQNAPLGAHISVSEDGKTLTSAIDYDTYKYQLTQRLASTCCAAGCARNTCGVYEKAIAQADTLNTKGHGEEAARLVTSSLEGLNRELWAQYPAFPATAIRGIWHRPVEKNAKEIGETLDYLKRAGLNTVFLETFFHGYTIFPSDVYTAFGITPNENPDFAGVDLLKLWTQEAHKRGMKVHVWFQTFYAGTKVVNPPGPILAKYPQWANVQYGALYVKPDPNAAKAADTLPLIKNPSDTTPVTKKISDAVPPKKAADMSAQPDTNGKTFAKTPVSAKASLPAHEPEEALVAPPVPPADPVTEEDNAPAATTKTSLTGTTATVTTPAPEQNTTPEQTSTSDATTLAAPLAVIKEAPPVPVSSTLELGAYFIDPANPDARGFLLSLINEIITKYDIDGFQFDYIRYPGSFPQDRFSYLKTTWGYTDIERKQFKDATGTDPAFISDKDNPQLWAQWDAYKTEQVSSFVQKAQGMIRAKRPDVLISAAVFPDIDKAREAKEQDWATWATNGWVDFLAPMTLTSAVKVVSNDTEKTIATVDQKVPVVSGVFGAFNNNTAEQLLDQIEAAREAGASGFNIFDTAHLTGRMVDALHAAQVK